MPCIRTMHNSVRMGQVALVVFLLLQEINNYLCFYLNQYFLKSAGTFPASEMLWYLMGCTYTTSYWFWIFWNDPLQTLKKIHFFTPARFELKLSYPRKCVICNKSEFSTKRHKIYFTTCMSQIRLSHIYTGNNYVINRKITLLISKVNNLGSTPKSAKLQHNSLVQKNRVNFGTHFTRARKKFTPVLRSRWNNFPSLTPPLLSSTDTFHPRSLCYKL